MPISRVSGEIGVTATTVTLTLDPLVSLVKAAVESLLFKGSLKTDSVPMGGETIEIWRRKVGELSFALCTTTTTDMLGGYSIGWVPPANLGCTSYEFKATHPSSNTWSGAQSSKVAFNTRVRNLTAPPSVAVNVNFTVSGYLEYESTPGVWSPLVGKTVNVYYNGNLMLGNQPVTDANGYFSKSDCKITASGTYTIKYTIKADYGGEGLAAIRLTVSSIVNWWNSLSLGKKILTVASAITGVGAGAYYVYKRKKRAR